jgi:hypothetical protein
VSQFLIRSTGFVTTVKAFQPSASKGKLASLFTIPEIGHENPGKPIAASAIQSCEPIWSDDKSALLFVTAKPPTGIPSSIGVLFLLLHQRSGWRIADLLRFRAIGKDAGVSAKLTAFAGSGRQLGSEGFGPVITVNESHGGRGYAYDTCAAYKFAGSRLKRLELE